MLTGVIATIYIYISINKYTLNSDLSPRNAEISTAKKGDI